MAVVNNAVLLDRFRAHLRRTPTGDHGLALAWPGFERALPDGGLPRGVVQLAASGALAGATRIALAAVRGAQRRDVQAWCAWIDPYATLYAPGVVAAGVDLGRLLVVRPTRETFVRTAVKVVASRACELVVVDVAPTRGASSSPARLPAADRFVRRLALASESAGGTVLLLTDAHTGSWPVALRLELSRTDPDTVHTYVGKDRHGRVGLEQTVAWPPRPGEEEKG